MPRRSGTNKPAARLLLSAGAAIFLSAGCATAPDSADLPAAATRYICEEGGSFTVARSGGTALVRFEDGGYQLERRRSSIGERFSSPGATLIIDGDYAVFVAEDRLDLSGCASTARIAKIPAPGG